MKQRARLLVFSHSFSINNYDPREIMQRLNESVYKAADEAWVEEMRKKIEEEVTPKLIA